MKSGINLLFFFLLLIISNSLIAQDETDGGIFQFEKYDPEGILQYEEIDPLEIKSVMLSYQKIPNTGINSYLFNPDEQSDNSISLDSLMMWAVRESHLVVYDNIFINEFDLEDIAITADTISPERITRNRKHWEYSDDQDMGVYDPPVVSYYLLLKSTVLGKNDKELAVRPLLISPIQTYLRWGMDTISEVLYTAYFPDILNLLKNHIPAEKIKGVKSTYDLFLKNKYYEVDYSNSMLQYDVFGDNLLYEDTIPGPVIEEGVFVDPRIGAFRGNPGSDRSDENAPTMEKPDLQGLSYAKYFKHTIALNEEENWPLYLPAYNIMGLRNTPGKLIDGLIGGHFQGYDFDSDRLLTIDEIKLRMVEVESMMIYDEFGNEEEIAYVESLYVEKLDVNELVFFDKNDKIIYREAIELIPLTSHFDYTEIPRYSAVCRIPIKEESVRNYLHNSLVFNLEGEKYESVLSFLSKRKYRPETSRIQPISLKLATEQIGSSYWEEMEPGSQYTTISDFNDNDAKIVIREVDLIYDNRGQEELKFRVYEALDTYLYHNEGYLTLDDIEIPVNYQIFYPQHEYNGYKPLFDLMKLGLKTEQVRAYKYTLDKFPGEELGLEELDRIMVYSDSIYDWEFDKYQEFTEEVPSSAIQKFQIMELHSESRIVPIAIAPDIAGISAYFMSELALGTEYFFWIPFSSQLQKMMMEQEILRVKNESLTNYYDFILGMNYEGKIIEQYLINKEELDVLIKLLK